MNYCVTVYHLNKTNYNIPVDELNENFMCATPHEASCTSGNFTFNEESYNSVLSRTSQFGSLSLNDMSLTGDESSFSLLYSNDSQSL